MSGKPLAAQQRDLKFLALAEYYKEFGEPEYPGKATSKILISPSNRRLMDILKCPICQSVMTPPILSSKSCAHRFCKTCLEDLVFKCNKCCPICRAEITTKRATNVDTGMGEIVNLFKLQYVEEALRKKDEEQMRKLFPEPRFKSDENVYEMSYLQRKGELLRLARGASGSDHSKASESELSDYKTPAILRNNGKTDINQDKSPQSRLLLVGQNITPKKRGYEEEEIAEIPERERDDFFNCATFGTFENWLIRKNPQHEIADFLGQIHYKAS